MLAQLERALARIADLERQLGLNSQNSSKPPSSDGPKQRAEHKKKKQAEQVGVDETGWRKGSLPHWIWVIQSPQVAVYRIRPGRTKSVAQEVIGQPGARIFVTDRYGAYSFLAAERHQICHAHLLREFVKMSELDGEVGRTGKKLEVLSRAVQKNGRA